MNIYFDECGDNGLDFNNATTKRLFVVCGVIVQDCDSEKLKQDLDTLVRVQFGNGQIRSKTVGDDDSKRIRILIELRKLRFTAYALLVRKDLLFTQGYKYKTVFYKNLPNRLYQALVNSNPNSLLWADPTGGKDFMRSLREYVLNFQPPNLFNNYNFSFLGSAESRYIQLADFIAGTLMRCFETKAIENSQSSLTMKSLLNGWCIWDTFPLDIKSYEYNPDSEEVAKWDHQIEGHALSQVERFIMDFENAEDLTIKDQISFLKLLTFHHLNISKSTFLPKYEIERKLASMRNVNTLPPRHLSGKIVGKLRSRGILISSNRRGGYKIPSGLADIYEFMNNINEKVSPMVQKAEIYWKEIKRITNQEVDILAPDAYSVIRRSLG